MCAKLKLLIFLPHGNKTVSSGRDFLGHLFRVQAVAVKIVVAHGLDTSTDTNVNETGLDRRSNGHASLQTRRALTVAGADASSLWETSGQRGHACRSGKTTLTVYVANANILDELGINAGAIDNTLENVTQELCI